MCDRIEELRHALSSLGFVEASYTGVGPMGSRQVKLNSPSLSVDVTNDRGQLAIGVGPRGKPTFGVQVWTHVLGVTESEEDGTEGDVKFFLQNMSQIEAATAADPSMLEKLKATNWRLVKERLGIDPDMPVPGSEKK
jgi:hypothetical protein